MFLFDGKLWKWRFSMKQNISIPPNVPHIEVRYDKNRKTTSRKAHNLENISIPAFELKQLSRYILKACGEFYSNPENVKRYEKWKSEK